MKKLKTAGQLRRHVLRLAAKCINEEIGVKALVSTELSEIVKMLSDGKGPPLGAVGLPEMNALGLAMYSCQVWHPVPAPLVSHAVRVVHSNLNRMDANSLYVYNLLRPREADESTRDLLFELCDPALTILEPEVRYMSGRNVYHVTRWAVDVHVTQEVAAGQTVPPSLSKVQFLNEVSERLAHPVVYPSLTLPEVCNTLFNFANMRLTPEGLFDSLAVHVVENLLPTLKKEREEAEATAATTPHTRSQYHELTLLTKAIISFAKAAELGRVPLRDVLEQLAHYFLDRDAPLLYMAQTKEIVRVSYLSVAISKRWGSATEEIDEEPIKEVLSLIGELSFTEDHMKQLLGNPQWQWRFLLNMTQAGEFDTVTKWLDILVGNPTTDPKLLSTLTYAVARIKDGLGFRDLPKTTPTDDEGDPVAVDAKAETIRSALSYFPAIMERFLLPKADVLELRHICHVTYAYARAAMLDSTMCSVMIDSFCDRLTKENLVPPYLITNFIHGLALSRPDGLLKGDLWRPFQAVEKKLASGELDFAPEKPNYTVYTLWAMQKVDYKSESLTQQLCELLNEEAIERLHLTTATMAVDALSKHPPMTAATEAAVRIVNAMAAQIEISGTMNPNNVDLMCLGLSRGPWNKDTMVEVMFRLSKAFMTSGSGRTLCNVDGKTLARLLWSHSVVMVKHTLLCGTISKMLEDKDFVLQKMDTPLSVTSALLAMSRLRLRNPVAVGNLCSATSSLASEMNAISLADMVQAVAELRLPSRGLQVTLCARVVLVQMEFTGEQAASFTWNLARSQVVPGVLKDALEKEVVARSYGLLLAKVALSAKKLDVRHVCRAFHTLGLLYPTNTYPQYIPLLYAAALQNIKDAWWRDLANFLWGLATVQYLPSDADLETISHYRSRQSFTPEDELRVQLWDSFVLSHKAKSS